MIAHGIVFILFRSWVCYAFLCGVRKLYGRVCCYHGNHHYSFKLPTAQALYCRFNQSCVRTEHKNISQRVLLHQILYTVGMYVPSWTGFVLKHRFGLSLYSRVNILNLILAKVKECDHIQSHIVIDARASIYFGQSEDCYIGHNLGKWISNYTKI